MENLYPERHFNKKLEYLLSNDPEKVISKSGIQIRKWTYPLYKKLVLLSTKNKLKFERMEELPKDRPIIFAATHGFRDDIAFSIASLDTSAYLLYGSIPDFFYSIDGYALFMNGSILIDRKDEDSRRASKDKMCYAIDLGANILMYPEGVWNKTPNLLVQKLYPGIYDVACEKNAIIVPLATMLENDGVGHVIRDFPFDITKYSKEEGLNLLRDRLCTLKWEIMECYYQAFRSDFPADSSSYWKQYVDALIETANGLYDYTIEDIAQYRDKNEISYEEVMAPIWNIHQKDLVEKGKVLKK